MACLNYIVTYLLRSCAWMYFVCHMTDPFADSQEERRDQTKVHVRVQQRSGRKCITTVQGLADDLDLKRILKAFKKNFR